MTETGPVIRASQLGDQPWRKSTRSGGTPDGSCVDVAPLADGKVAVRHSHHPDGAAIVYNADEWAAFMAGAKSGEFDF
ncbi:transcriptional regulator [Longispora fulva]|uniref:DUF397 domain-containing protein n=1 Tax=Longispora fulva TaxID=619741 RepID=UPI0018CAFBCB|nr:DUF397 domain-containing protein [Longispora fulva]GIG56996.1 transcriptional regulator [Longispora fulva]